MLQPLALEKMKNSAIIVKIIKDWWDFSGIKENPIPSSGILMG